MTLKLDKVPKLIEAVRELPKAVIEDHRELSSLPKAEMIAKIKDRIRNAEESFYNSLAHSLYYEAPCKPLTPEQIAKYEAEQKEYNRPINRLKRKLNEYKWRIKDAWEVLAGRAEIKDCDDEDY